MSISTGARIVAIGGLLVVAGLVSRAQEPQSRSLWQKTREVNTWGRVSGDGRYLAFANGGDLNLYIRDLERNVTRRLTSRPPPGGPDYGVPGDDVWAFSADGSQLAYSWAFGNREELRIISTRDTNAQPRTLIADPDIRFMTAWNWSPDGQTIVVGIWRRGRPESELGIVSVTNGTYRVLVRVPTPAGDNQGAATLSPDGRFIAYSPREKGSRDIHLVPVAGGDPLPLITGPTNDSVLGWLVDGPAVVFTSDRDGKQSIRAVAVTAAGAPGGERVLHTDLPIETGLGLTARGELLYEFVPEVRWRAAVVAIDLQDGRVISRVQEVRTDSPDLALHPDGWSPDGRHLALRSTLGDEDREPFTFIRDNRTGALRQVPRRFAISQHFWWSPDGASFIVRGSVKAGLMPAQCCPIHRVDAATGEPTELVPLSSHIRGVTASGNLLFDTISTDGFFRSRVIEYGLASGQQRILHTFDGGDVGRQSVAVSEDGRMLFYRRPDDLTRPQDLVKRDLASGTETVLVSAAKLGPLTSAAGGRFVLTAIDGRTMLVPSSSGPPVPIPLAGGASPEILVWSTDGRAFLGRTRTADSATYWWVPLDGRAPRKIDAGIGPWAAGFVSRGSDIAFGERLGPASPLPEIRIVPLVQR